MSTLARAIETWEYARLGDHLPRDGVLVQRSLF